MRLIFFSAALLFVNACTTPSSVKVDSPAPTDGKAVAPVDLQAELSPREAKVTIRLDEDASDIAINVWGLDGLTVGTPNAFTPALSRRGQSETVVVPMTPAQGRSNLAVSVSGTFHGAKLQRVATFAVGDGPLKQTGEVTVTNQGDVIKARRAPEPSTTQTPSTQTP